MSEAEKTEADMSSTENVPDEQPKIPKKINKKLSLTSVILVVLVVGLLGALGYLYSNKTSSINNLETEVAQLKLDASKMVSSAPTKDVTPAKNAGPAKETVPIKPVEVVAPCSGSSSYTASVGKFTATLDSPHVIVRKLDAGFEGGPITSLNIASCLPSETNVYDFPPQSEVSVLAHPASSSADLKASYEASSGVLTANGTVMVDGVTANKYKSSGLFEATLVYFDKAGIGYQIELSDTNATSSAILTDLTADWSFTP